MLNYRCRNAVDSHYSFGEHYSKSGEEAMDNVTNVLIADNSQEFCAGLTAALQRAGGFHVVATANDGEKAIALVNQFKPQVLVLDLMLAKQDGISVLKAISGMDRKPATLATSRFVTDYVANAKTCLTFLNGNNHCNKTSSKTFFGVNNSYISCL